MKRSESGMIVDPITLSPSHRIYEALDLMKKYRISGVPITEDGSKRGRLVGILTNRDLRFETNAVTRAIGDVMTRENLITVPVGTTLDSAREILHLHKVEKLLVVDHDFRLKGLITVKDIQKAVKYPFASKDSLGRLRCGAACRRRPRHAAARRGAGGGARRRASSSIRRTVIRRVLLDMVRRVAPAVFGRRSGRGATWRRAEATDALIGLGVDAVKVGIGAGVDLHDAGDRRHRRADDHRRDGMRARRRRHDIPVIAATAASASPATSRSAIAVSASTTMIGNLFAGTDEPGRADSVSGPQLQDYRGMGSARSRGSRDRCRQDDFDLDSPGGTDKLVPEGIEGRDRAPQRQRRAMVPSSWAACALAWLLRLRQHSDAAARRQAHSHHAGRCARDHVHDVAITKEAPNCRSE